MVELGFSLQAKYDCPNDQVISLLKEAGLAAISPVWTPDLPLEQLAAAAQAHGMTIQSLHAPHGDKSCLWNPQDPRSRQIEENIKRSIDACAQFQIPVTVLHGWEGFFYTFREETLDFSVFDRIVEHAGQLGVSIALENLEGEEFLNALMTRYSHLPHIGFCWDTGHDHCYPHKMDFLEAFGQRLIMTHINDNFGLRAPDGTPNGDDDLHFLPYDGNIQWEHTIGRMKGLPRQKILNFEIKQRSFSTAARDLIYTDLAPEAFFQLAGQRARQIATLYEQVMATE